MVISTENKIARAKEKMTISECWWGADAELFGTTFANKQVAEAENELATLSSKIIAGLE